MAIVSKTSPKGSLTSEVVIGRAGSKLKSAVEGLRAAVGEINSLSERAEELQAVIGKREEQIANLDTEYSEKKRAADANLEIEVKKAKRVVVDTFMDNQGLIAVDAEEYQSKLSRLAEIEKNFKADLDKEVAKEKAILTARFEADKKLAEATHSANVAAVNAELNQKNAQIEFLNEQVKGWKDALDSERNASVERAKASAIGSVNIGGSGK